MDQPYLSKSAYLTDRPWICKKNIGRLSLNRWLKKCASYPNGVATTIRSCCTLTFWKDQDPLPCSSSSLCGPIGCEHVKKKGPTDRSSDNKSRSTVDEWSDALTETYENTRQPQILLTGTLSYLRSPKYLSDHVTERKLTTHWIDDYYGLNHQTLGYYANKAFVESLNKR